MNASLPYPSLHPSFDDRSICHQHVKANPNFQKDTRDLSHSIPVGHRKPSSAYETRNSAAYSKPSKIPKHSGPASQPLPEQSTMQLVRKSHGCVSSVILWSWPLHDARLDVALCIPNGAMCCSQGQPLASIVREDAELSVVIRPGGGVVK